MAMNDPPHIGQADAGPLELLDAVQALKHAKQLVDVPHVEADAVVADKEHALIRFAPAADLNFGCRARPCILDRVGDQVAEGKPEHRGVALNIRKRPDLPGDVAFPDLRLDLALDLSHQLAHGNPLPLHIGAPHPGKGEQIVHQGSRVPGRFPDGLQVTAIGFIHAGREK